MTAITEFSRIEYIEGEALTPDKSMEPGVVYIRDAGPDWGKFAEFLCPCGKPHAGVVLPLNPSIFDEKGTWIFQDIGGKPDFSPSIHRIRQPHCHYFIKRGKVQWCN